MCRRYSISPLAIHLRVLSLFYYIMSERILTPSQEEQLLVRQQHPHAQHGMIPEKSDENAETLEQQVVGWLATPTYRDERRYLDNHPAPIISQTDVLLEQRIAETMATRASLLAQQHHHREQLATSSEDVQLQSQEELAEEITQGSWSPLDPLS